MTADPTSFVAAKERAGKRHSLAWLHAAYTAMAQGPEQSTKLADWFMPRDGLFSKRPLIFILGFCVLGRSKERSIEPMMFSGKGEKRVEILNG